VNKKILVQVLHSSKSSRCCPIDVNIETKQKSFGSQNPKNNKTVACTFSKIRYVPWFIALEEIHHWTILWFKMIRSDPSYFSYIAMESAHVINYDIMIRDWIMYHHVNIWSFALFNPFTVSNNRKIILIFYNYNGLLEYYTFRSIQT